MDVPDDPGIETFMWHMFRTNQFESSYDSVFVLKTKDGERTFRAHKMLLALWSPKFEDMFYKQESCENSVELYDVDPEAFQDMLKFMYCYDPVLGTMEKACKLYKLAAQFEVASLARFCRESFASIDVNVSNVLDMYEVAATTRDRDLMTRCTRIIQDETKSLFSCYDCCDISSPMAHVILDRPKLSLDSESELLQWMFAWAKNEVLDRSENCGLRDVLAEFLPKMQFLALTNTEFATICKAHKDFFTAQEALSIFKNIAIRNSCPLPDWYGSKAKLRVYARRAKKDCSAPSQTEGADAPVTKNDRRAPSKTDGVDTPVAKNDRSVPSQTEGADAPVTKNDRSAPSQTEGVDAPVAKNDRSATSQTKQVDAPKAKNDRSAASQTKQADAPVTINDRRAPSQTREDAPVAKNDRSAASQTKQVDARVAKNDRSAMSQTERVDACVVKNDRSGLCETRQVDARVAKNDRSATSQTKQVDAPVPKNDLRALSQTERVDVCVEKTDRSALSETKKLDACAAKNDRAPSQTERVDEHVAKNVCSPQNQKIISFGSRRKQPRYF